MRDTGAAVTGEEGRVNDADAPRTPRALRAIAYIGMFVFGIVIALLGAVMPMLSGPLSLSLADVGALFLLMNFAMVTTSLVLGPVMDRVGLKAPLAIGAGLAAVSLLLIGTATHVSAMWAAVVCLGVGGAALNGGTNTLVADLHADPREKASALNVLGVFYGFGALCLPFALGALLSRFGLSGLLVTTAGFCLIVSMAAAAVRFPPPKRARRGGPAAPDAGPGQDGARGGLAEALAFLRRPIVLTLALLLFFESGSEFVLGGYLSTFLTRDLAVPVSSASYLLAAYWAAIMVGRVISSRVLLRLGASTVILVSALLSALGTLIVGLAATPIVAAIGMILTGLSLAGIFPTVLGLAGARFRDHSGTVFGVLFTVALTGGMVLPFVSGYLAESISLRAAFGLIAASFLAVAALTTIAARVRES